MQKIKKFWHAVRKQSLKKSNWAKFDLMTPPTGGQEFFSKLGKRHFSTFMLFLLCAKYQKLLARGS